MKVLTVLSLVVSTLLGIVQLIKELKDISMDFIYNIDMGILIRFLITWACVFVTLWSGWMVLKFFKWIYAEYRAARSPYAKLDGAQLIIFRELEEHQDISPHDPSMYFSDENPVIMSLLASGHIRRDEHKPERLYGVSEKQHAYLLA